MCKSKETIELETAIAMWKPHDLRLTSPAPIEHQKLKAIRRRIKLIEEGALDIEEQSPYLAQDILCLLWMIGGRANRDFVTDLLKRNP